MASYESAFHDQCQRGALASSLVGAVIAGIDARIVCTAVNLNRHRAPDSRRITIAVKWVSARNLNPAILLLTYKSDLGGCFRKILILAKNQSDIVGVL